jgi:dsRNA-specific ribonuclease
MVKAHVKGHSMYSEPYSWPPPAPGALCRPRARLPAVLANTRHVVIAPSSDLKSNSHSLSNPTLKRQRTDLSSAPSSAASGAKMSSLPPIPKLNGEVLLDVFTHRSLRFHGAPLDDSSEYGDNIRLAVLGKVILEACITDTLFKKRPMLPADQIEVRSVRYLCAESFSYRLSSGTARRHLVC